MASREAPFREDRIRNLDDATALRLLSTMARPRLHDSGLVTEATFELRQALVDEFGPASASAPSEGELARQALLVLAETPTSREPLSMLLDGPVPRSLGPKETVEVITAALLVLQMHVRIERTGAGKWKLLFEKTASTEAFLKPLVSKFLALFPGGKP